MLKTDRWNDFMSDNNAQPRTLTDAERRALIYAPFPVVRVTMPTHPGHSQAPNWVMEATQRAEGIW